LFDKHLLNYPYLGYRIFKRAAPKSFREQNIRAVGVRDPDIGEDTATGLFSLPGDKAPESLLLDSDNIARAEKLVNGILNAFDRAKVQGNGFTGSIWSKKIFVLLKQNYTTYIGRKKY
jgi:hypothetical protein